MWNEAVMDGSSTRSESFGKIKIYIVFHASPEKDAVQFRAKKCAE
jgi:hypothetical protein